MMVHAKHQGFILYLVASESFCLFSLYKPLSYVTLSIRPFSATGPLGDATYQISSIKMLLFQIQDVHSFHSENLFFLN